MGGGAALRYWAPANEGYAGPTGWASGPTKRRLPHWLPGVLVRHKGMSSLWLSCDLSDTALEGLTAILQGHRRLTSLRLENRGGHVGPDGAALLAEVTLARNEPIRPRHKLLCRDCAN